MSHISIKSHWFSIGILGSILLAEIFPAFGVTEGPLKPEWTVNYVGVAVIYFFSGLSLSGNDIILAVKQIKVHSFVQIYTFIFVPLCAVSLTNLLEFLFDVNKWILTGFAIVSCLPPPITSPVIMTKAVGGNEAVAIFNSVVGCIIALVTTPLVLFLILGKTTIVYVDETLSVIWQTVFIPIIIGQVARRVGILNFLVKFPYIHTIFPTIGQLVLLVIIYSTFCDVFQMYDIPMNASDIIVTVLLVVTFQMMIQYGSFKLASSYAFSASDVPAMIFCSTHKSITLGIPIMRILFSGYDYYTQVSLSLILCHPTQIILSGFVLPHLKKWTEERNGCRKKIINPRDVCCDIEGLD